MPLTAIRSKMSALISTDPVDALLSDGEGIRRLGMLCLPSKREDMQWSS